MNQDNFYNDCFKYAYNISINILKDHQLAEDSAHDTIYLIYKNICNFKHNSKLETWIYRIALNTAFGILRKRNSLSNNLITNFVNLDDKEYEKFNFDQNYLRRKIIMAYHKLPMKYKEIYKLYSFQNKSFSHIADKLKLNYNSVKTREFRARKIMKKLLSSDENLKNYFWLRKNFKRKKF